MDLIGHKSAGEIARYSDQEMLLYDRLGSRARATIGAAHRVIDIKVVLGAFLRTRQRGPDKWVNGDLIPSLPPPSVYIAEGDAEFAKWIDEKILKDDIGMTSAELMLVPLREGRLTRLATSAWRRMRR